MWMHSDVSLAFGTIFALQPQKNLFQVHQSVVLYKTVFTHGISVIFARPFMSCKYFILFFLFQYYNSEKLAFFFPALSNYFFFLSALCHLSSLIILILSSLGKVSKYMENITTGAKSGKITNSEEINNPMVWIQILTFSPSVVLNVCFVEHHLLQKSRFTNCSLL